MQKYQDNRTRHISLTLALSIFIWLMFHQAQSARADALPPPVVTGNSLELCLNSRYSQHSLSKTAVSTQQLSNILWAAGKVPFTGSNRNIYAITSAGTYLYDPISHSLSWFSNEVTSDGSFAIRCDSELDFDTGVSFMSAMLASVSLGKSTESPVASCPKGLAFPKTRLIFGVQSVKGLTSTLGVHSSVSQGQSGWLPDPSTTGTNKLEEVLANLKYTGNFAQTNLTLQQISQILWAGYGCSNHTTTNSRAGLTVPSAMANYYLTGSIYLLNENGVFRYHNRNPSTNMATRDHRTEQINTADVRVNLRSAVSGLPAAPCYVILCLNSSSYTGQQLEFAQLEAGFAASNMLIQATAIDLGCHFKTKLTSAEQSSIRAATNIPASNVPQAIVSIGPVGSVSVLISVALQGNSRPETGWAVPLTVRFFAPGADILNGTPTYEFNLTTAKSTNGNTTVCEATGVATGTYDIAAIGETTLMNVKRSVVVSSPDTLVDLGTLLEGNANQDNIINLYDLVFLSLNWLASRTNVEYDARADFDRNGFINAADLYLLAINWLKCSPVAISP
jgi:hypothetical protein